MNACDEVNHGGERYVVSNIDQTVIVPDHVGHLLLSVAAGATRIELPEDPEPDGFARVRHVADPDAKQNPPASATLGPPVSQVPSQQWPMVNFDASGRKRKTRVPKNAQAAMPALGFYSGRFDEGASVTLAPSGHLFHSEISLHEQKSLRI